MQLVSTPLDDNHVGVVEPADGDEDFGAWDAGAAGGLAWLAATRGPQDEDEQDPESPDYTLRDTTAWGHSTGREGVVRPVAETQARKLDLSDFMPRFDAHQYGVNSAGIDLPEKEEPEIEQDGEEDQEDERTSADLLRQDGDAWTDGESRVAPGVIE